jgi:hypothetical protein
MCYVLGRGEHTDADAEKKVLRTLGSYERIN